jgi:hypothetical protein
MVQAMVLLKTPKAAHERFSNTYNLGCFEIFYDNTVIVANDIGALISQMPKFMIFMD